MEMILKLVNQLWFYYKNLMKLDLNFWIQKSNQFSYWLMINLGKEIALKALGLYIKMIITIFSTLVVHTITKTMLLELQEAKLCKDHILNLKIIQFCILIFRNMMLAKIVLLLDQVIAQLFKITQINNIGLFIIVGYGVMRVKIRVELWILIWWLLELMDGLRLEMDLHRILNKNLLKLIIKKLKSEFKNNKLKYKLNYYF